MNKIFDLRFVIGSFFTIIGILLLIFSFMNSPGLQQDINRWCGIAFILFGIFMIILSLRKDAHDELMEKNE